MPVMHISEMEYKLRCHYFFSAIWHFLIGNQEKCLVFIRYYHSQYFKKYSLEKHKKRYQSRVNKFADHFKNDVNVWITMHHILATTLGFAIKVFNRKLENDENTEKYVFELVYSTSFKKCFKCMV